MNDILVLTGLTLIDAAFIYFMIKNGGAGTELTVLTLCLTFVVAIVWLLMIGTAFNA